MSDFLWFLFWYLMAGFSITAALSVLGIGKPDGGRVLAGLWIASALTFMSFIAVEVAR